LYVLEVILWWVMGKVYLVVVFHLGYYPASEFCVSSFQNTLSVPSSRWRLRHTRRRNRVFRNVDT